jgi:predicted kinase
MSSIILITGNMASGKSTVAQSLAEQLPKCVHLRGDMFRRMIVTGQAEMTFELSSEAQAQLQLRYELAAEVAKRYVTAGFAVVYQDIVIGHALETVVAALRPHVVDVVILCPRPHAIAVREQSRDKRGYADSATIEAFDHVLRFQTPRIGYWLDSSDLTVSETVQSIVSYLKQVQAPCIAT